MATLASVKLGRVSVWLGKGVTDRDISKIVGLVKGKYGCLGCGFLGKLRDIEGIRETVKGIKSVEKIAISNR